MPENGVPMRFRDIDPKPIRFIRIYSGLADLNRQKTLKIKQPRTLKKNENFAKKNAHSVSRIKTDILSLKGNFDFFISK